MRDCLVMIRFSVLLLTAAMVATGCAPRDPSPDPAAVAAPPLPAPVPADVSLVALEGDFDPGNVAIRIRAPAGHPVYLMNCNGAFSWGLQQETAGGWRPAWTIAMNGCASAPITLAPGEARVFHQALAPSADEAIAAGTYRLAVYGLFDRYAAHDLATSSEVPEALRVTAPFAVAAIGGGSTPPR